ncbi:MAG: rhomboid family intramembrane serine protease [Actinobacteria bacterium]|nr:rhomboid family intramembrane serine protease [Actinomycetota bacterium]
MKRNTTTSLITIICGFYLLTLVRPGLQENLFLINKAILSDGVVHGVGAGEWYRILTVALVHGGLMHLGFNMYALLVLGNPLEASFGRGRFITIFMISLVTGSVASLLFNAVNQPSVGASGALFGLFGAFAVAGKRMGADVRSIYVILGINFAISFIVPNVDWHAHLGGLLGGAVTSWVFLQVAKRR